MPVELWVSILIQPEGRMQHVIPDGGVGALGVSILIQPEGRMQRGSRAGEVDVHCFNPHPARRPDATYARNSVSPSSNRFNPHPARRPDATQLPARLGDVPRVSILIQPEGRMQPHGEERYAGPIRVSILIQPEGRMQHADYQGANRRCPGFNPHPARRPDATVDITSSTVWSGE